MKKQIGTFDAFQKTIERLSEKSGGDGLLLIAGRNGNPMTIGWGTIGIIWKIPIFTVLVRHTRYTHELIEQSGQFSVNVLDDGYGKQIMYCGTNSGRDGDKVKACGFTLEHGTLIDIPHLREASVVYECRIVHRNEVTPETLQEGIYKHYYTREALHTVYNGEILGVFKEE